MMQQLTKADFLKQIFDFESNTLARNKNKTPCVVYFYTEINNACFLQNDILNALSKSCKGISFYKVDALREQILAADLGIRHVPTFLFVPLNKALKMTSGVLSEQTLRQNFQHIFGIKML